MYLLCPQIWGLVDFLDYWRKICTEICDHMGIYCFRIKPGAAAAAEQPGASRAGRVTTRAQSRLKAS